MAGLSESVPTVHSVQQHQQNEWKMFKCCVCSEMPVHIKLQSYLNFWTVKMEATQTKPKTWNWLHKLITSLMARPKFEGGVSDTLFNWPHWLVSELPMHLFNDHSIFTPNYTLLCIINITWYNRGLHFKQTLFILVHTNCITANYQDLY